MEEYNGRISHRDSSGGIIKRRKTEDLKRKNGRMEMWVAVRQPRLAVIPASEARPESDGDDASDSGLRQNDASL